MLSLKFLVPTALLLVGLLATLIYRDSRLRGLPELGHPFDADDLGTVAVDASQNAKGDYQRAFERIDVRNEPDSDELERVLEGSWSEVTPVVQQWLENNQDTLSSWRRGTDQSIYLRAQPIDLTVENFCDPVAEGRAIIRLASLAAQRAESLGEFDEAWAWHLANYRFSRHTGMYDTSIQRMIGAAYHKLAVAGILRWVGNGQVTTEQLAQAIADVRLADQMTAPPSAAIRADYFVALDELRRLDELRGTYAEVMKSFGVRDGGIPHQPRLFLENEPRLTRRLLQHQVANFLAHADLPWQRQPPMVAGQCPYFDATPTGDAEWLSGTEFAAVADRSSLVGSMLLKDSRGSLIRELMRQRVLEVVLAAEWFRREHGVFPESLRELVEAGVIDHVPVDPLSPTEDPLRYERDQTDRQRARVWSVGWDGIENGGAVSSTNGNPPADSGRVLGNADP